ARTAVPTSLLMSLEVVELELDRELRRVVAEERIEARQPRLDVEVVAGRVVVHAERRALLVLRVRRGELALLVACIDRDPRHLEVEAGLDLDDVRARQRRGEDVAAVEVVELERGDEGPALDDRVVEEEVAGEPAVILLGVVRRADGEDLLRAEVV